MLRHCWATLWWVHYHSKIPTHQKISPRNHITSMQIFMTDENMEIINFNGLPLRFELEIIWKKIVFWKYFAKHFKLGATQAHHHWTAWIAWRAKHFEPGTTKWSKWHPDSKSLYPSFPADAKDLRFKKICNYQKELENEISITAWSKTSAGYSHNKSQSTMVHCSSV